MKSLSPQSAGPPVYTEGKLRGRGQKGHLKLYFEIEHGNRLHMHAHTHLHTHTGKQLADRSCQSDTAPLSFSITA